MEYEEPAVPSFNEGIEIDLGIKDLTACSDEHKYLNINKTQKIKKLVHRFLIPHIPSTRYLYTRIKKRCARKTKTQITAFHIKKIHKARTKIYQFRRFECKWNDEKQAFIQSSAEARFL